MLKSVLVAAAVALFSLSLQASANDDDDWRVEQDVAGDHFAADCPLRVNRPVEGDLFAAGCSVDIGGPVTGDAFASGSDVRIGAPVGQSLYVLGGQIHVGARVARHVRIAGGQVVLGSTSDIGGNVLIASGDLRVEGPVKGYVRVAGGRVRIDGPVDGDVLVTAGSVELGPNARIGGRLRYASEDAVRRDPSAQVRGGIERLQLDDEGHASERAGEYFVLGGAVVWTIGLMLMAAVLTGVFPGFVSRVTDTVRTRGWMSALLGFVALVCIPVAIVVLMMTLVGIPLALLALGFYLVLLLLGYVATGLGVGAWALARFQATRAEARWWRIGAAALGVLAVSLLGWVPYLGAVIAFAALLIGLGALLLAGAGAGRR